MADRRKEPRVRASVLVEVSGSDAHGDTFHEAALATNLSRSGALLTRVCAEPRCGDLVVVHHAGRQAHFRVVCVMNSGTIERVEVAIHKVDADICPWEEILSIELVDVLHADHR